MTTIDRLVRHRIDVTGLVQGVGFRPHVARIACELGLAGWVRNDGDGATIEIQGRVGAVADFERKLVDESPPLARIDDRHLTAVSPTNDAAFLIIPSAEVRSEGGRAIVPPDTATCAACLVELFDATDRRYRHAFIACTDCGPRWTMITGLPYDRERTTMARFDMCDACSAEYHDPAGRRFHAQPIGCHDCGPRLRRQAGMANTAPAATSDEIIAATQADLRSGRIVALKGVGGYHLAVDASNDLAVRRLRRRKRRPDKPFAVMVRDLDAARRLAHISDDEASALASPARPIVLLRARDAGLSPLVAPASPLIGLLLPYTPLHHLLFQPRPAHEVPFPEALVMTSGNVAGEPLAYVDETATEQLGQIADAFCSHDREIVTPCDDSVMRVIAGELAPIRRSRGYAPLPVKLPFSVPPLLALGGDLKNTCCVAAGRRALLSQHLGNMDRWPTQHAAAGAADALSVLHSIRPSMLVHDRHPGYFTTEIARRAELVTVPVGHHHAHLAAVMAENQVAAEGQTIGFLFDGTGWGDDDELWGGEVLVGGYDSIDRRFHLEPTKLPGGDAAVRQPWRMALSYARAAGVSVHDLAAAEQGTPVERSIVDHQLVTGFNSPTTTSMGRLFDAVASLLDVRHAISHEAQAAIELEALAASSSEPGPLLRFNWDREGTISAAGVIRSLVDHVRSGRDRASLAKSFHLAVATLIADVATQIASEQPALDTVALSGGVFQNDVLTTEAIRLLEARRFRVLTHRLVPANDGGLALGQAAIAGYRHHRAAAPLRGGF